MPLLPQLERVLGAGRARLRLPRLLFLEVVARLAIDFDATWHPSDPRRLRARRPHHPVPGRKSRAYPHLTSMLHTWALCGCRATDFSAYMWMSHCIGVTIVVSRMLRAACLARSIFGGRDVRGLWAAFFLFPSIFSHDLGDSPITPRLLCRTCLAAVRPRVRALRHALLRAARRRLGGHVLVKYSPVYLIAAMGGALHAGKRFLAARRGRAPTRATGAQRVRHRSRAFVGERAPLRAERLFYNNPAVAQRVFILDP